MLAVQKTHLMVPVLSLSSTLQTSPSLPLRVLNDLLLEIDITLPETETPLLPSSKSFIDLLENSGFSEMTSAPFLIYGTPDMAPDADLKKIYTTKSYSNKLSALMAAEFESEIRRQAK